MTCKLRTVWGVMWRSTHEQYLMTDWRGKHARHIPPKLFGTKREATEWIKEHYAEYATRRDLRAEPYGWRMPIPVRVTVEVKT